MMRKTTVLALIFLVLSFLLPACGERPKEQQKTSAFESLSGPYLGQTPPGLEPEVFAPGLISTQAQR